MWFWTFTRIALLAFLFPASAAAVTDDPVFGHWLSAGGDAIVEVQPCWERACGRIVWLRHPRDVSGRRRRDTRNKNRELRNDLLCGMTVLGGFRRQRRGAWRDGYIYNPETGRLRPARMTVRSDGQLEVRSHVGLPIFGTTRIWTRVKGERDGC